jgi:hypothetical protein
LSRMRIEHADLFDDGDAFHRWAPD